MSEVPLYSIRSVHIVFVAAHGPWKHSGQQPTWSSLLSFHAASSEGRLHEDHRDTYAPPHAEPYRYLAHRKAPPPRTLR
jgi:hypothetical protein